MQYEFPLSSCEASIALLHDAVDSNCGASAELVPGPPFLGLTDQLWSNWKQACLTDPTSGDNCNGWLRSPPLTLVLSVLIVADVIAVFPDVDEITDLPTADLCSYCNVQRLALLHADIYSDTYTDEWQTTYEIVAQICNLTVTSFDPPDSVFNVTVSSETVDCISGNIYTTTEGDTCNSIAEAFSVSAATMFYINLTILNCSSRWGGTNLCLPEECESIYTVQANDTRSEIAVKNGILTIGVVTLTLNSTLIAATWLTPNPSGS